MAMELKLDPSWKTILSDELEKSYFIRLNDILTKAYQSKDIWPKEENIFHAFNSTSLSEIKVVIIGQDPYPTPNHANGLCFSVSPEIKPFPKSLNNIFKELKNDLSIDPHTNGDLTRWAEQGVFLLNTVLTVEASNANSHKKIGWQEFTNAVIKIISDQNNGVIFLLWGNQAITKKKIIDQNCHHILESVHPSPLSAYRGFFGCKHFSKANELLILQGKVPINW